VPRGSPRRGKRSWWWKRHPQRSKYSSYDPLSLVFITVVRYASHAPHQPHHAFYRPPWFLDSIRLNDFLKSAEARVTVSSGYEPKPSRNFRLIIASPLLSHVEPPLRWVSHHEHIRAKLRALDRSALRRVLGHNTSEGSSTFRVRFASRRRVLTQPHLLLCCWIEYLGQFCVSDRRRTSATRTSRLEA